MADSPSQPLVATVADSCIRCGTVIPGAASSLCADCVTALGKKPSLTAEDVVEATRFAGRPLVSVDRIVVTIGVAMTPVILALFFITMEFLGDCRGSYLQSLEVSAYGVTVVFWLAGMVALVGLPVLALGARRQFLRYSVIALCSAFGLVLILWIACLFPLELGLSSPEGFRVLREQAFGGDGVFLFGRPLATVWIVYHVFFGLCVLMLVIPVAFALRGARRVAAARQELRKLLAQSTDG